MTTYGLYKVGDYRFQAQRRAWSQAASRADAANFGYLFTQPQPATAAQGLGGKIDAHISPLWYPHPCSLQLFVKCIMVPKSCLYTVLQTTLLQRRRRLAMPCLITGFRSPQA